MLCVVVNVQQFVSEKKIFVKLPRHVLSRSQPPTQHITYFFYFCSEGFSGYLYLAFELALMYVMMPGTSLLLPIAGIVSGYLCILFFSLANFCFLLIGVDVVVVIVVVSTILLHLTTLADISLFLPYFAASSNTGDNRSTRSRKVTYCSCLFFILPPTL